jgi:hypothetical protein
MKLREIAHSRSGDKGNDSTISVIAYKQENYPILEKYITAERVKEFFSEIVKGEVIRYTLPGLVALNFVLHDSLSGGVSRSLALDVHGKALSSALLEMEIPDTEADS